MKTWGNIFLAIIIGLLIQASLYAQNEARPYIKGLYSLPLSLDPIKMNDTASLVVGNLIYDGLLKFSPSLQIEGALAESWSTSQDGLTLTFKLKPKIIFHDGTPITAADAKASLLRALSAESKVRKFYDCISDISARDDKTLVITLSHPFPPFLSVLAGATAKILPQSKLSGPKFFDHPIGSGAFRFVQQDKSEIHLQRFDSNYEAKPQIEKMILKATTEEKAIKLAQTGAMDDLASWPLTADNAIFASGKKISAPVAATWIIGLNTTKAPFDNLEVRQRFKLAVPTETFRTTFNPDALSATGYVPYGLPGSQVKTQITVKNAPPPKAKITIAIPTELARASEMKLFFENALQAKGWNVEFTLTPWDQLMDGYAKHTLQGFLVSMNMDYPDADFLLKNFESTSPDNFSGLKNKKLDELLQNSRASRDRKKREQLYEEALHLVEESAVTVNLFYPRANYWVSNCVSGFIPNILSDVYIDYTKVNFNSDCAMKSAVTAKRMEKR